MKHLTAQQQEQMLKRFLKARDRATEKERKIGKLWCHTPEASAFYKKWDDKFNKLQSRLEKQRREENAEIEKRMKLSI